MGLESLTSSFIESYNNLVSLFPEHLKIIPPLFFIAATIALYSLFIFFFYRFLAKRDVLKLHLSEYNIYKHSFLIKAFAVIFYIIEFIIITPIVIFFWFAILAIFLILLAKELEVGTIILVCAALISAIRITAYFKEDLSRDLAKMIPFTLLGVAVLTPGFLDLGTSIARMGDLPLFFNNAIYYLLFISGLEIVLRLFYLPFAIAGSKQEETTEEVKKKE